MKKKVYVLMVAKYFPAGHPRAGEETYFKQKIMLNVKEPDVPYDIEVHSKKQKFILDTTAYKNQLAFDNGWSIKKHTIRTNYDLWARRAEKINHGEAVLSLRQWSGKPYRSKQEEFLRLEKISVQMIALNNRGIIIHENNNFVKWKEYAWSDLPVLITNDGFGRWIDFFRWFNPGFKDPRIERLLNFSGCIIHFTDFKY
jgi:hypothetical protein